MEKHAKVHTKTWCETQRRYDKFLIPWQEKKAADIAKQQVKTLHAKIGNDHGIYEANRVLQLLRAVYNHALREELLDGLNPCIGVKKFPEKKRDRFLQPDELSRFFEAVMAETNDVIRDYILVSLLTGARRSNVLTMRKEQIDFTNAMWRIPDTKNGEPHIIPLVSDAVEIIRSRLNKSSGEWVFPSTSKSGHLVEPRKAWLRILKNAGIENLRLHDLRRTLGSYQAMTGASLPIIGKSLGHKSQAATAIYARLNNDPVRDSMNKAVDAMRSAGGLTKNVEESDHAKKD